MFPLLLGAWFGASFFGLIPTTALTLVDKFWTLFFCISTNLASAFLAASKSYFSMPRWMSSERLGRSRMRSSIILFLSILSSSFLLDPGTLNSCLPITVSSSIISRSSRTNARSLSWISLVSYKSYFYVSSFLKDISEIWFSSIPFLDELCSCEAYLYFAIYLACNFFLREDGLKCEGIKVSSFLLLTNLASISNCGFLNDA